MPSSQDSGPVCERLHDRKGPATSLFLLPVQWPRYLDQIRFTPVVFQVELLRVGQRDRGWPVPHLDGFTYFNAEAQRDSLREITTYPQLEYGRL